MRKLAVAPLLPLGLCTAAALQNGLGLTPPMGWRSWNHFGYNVSQQLIMSIMDGMVDRRRMVDGVPTSLCDLGYCDVGLDDGWQHCNRDREGGYAFHDEAGNPIVNLVLFPNITNMTDHAHKKGLKAGWYLNNCHCEERKAATFAMYQNDVRHLADIFQFDSVKLDGCGTQLDLDLWQQLINDTGRPVTIENCHWGLTVPNETWCPWHFFRTSNDIRASYGSVVGNLLSTVPWARLSKPGCWAYPDMLEVGCRHGPGGERDPGLSLAEARSHFAAWCIVSSPLTLSHDVRDDAVMDEIWPIISNKEAIAVNQAWAGHSGSPFNQSEAHVLLQDFKHRGAVLVPVPLEVPVWQYFYKPLGGGKVAVLMMNHGALDLHLKLHFQDVPGLLCSWCHAHDIWRHEDLAPTHGAFEADVPGHDSVFLLLRPMGRATLRGAA